MKLLVALDLSTKPGFATFRDRELIRYGTLFQTAHEDTFGTYPMNFVWLAQHVAKRLMDEVFDPLQLNYPDTPIRVITEETTPGHDAYAQKKLEFIHFSVAAELYRRSIPQYYCRDGSWKSAVGVRFNDTEKQINLEIERQKKAGAKLARLDLGDGRGVRVVGKRTRKHAALRHVQEIFGITLKDADEDGAEALLLAFAFLTGVKLCNGKAGGSVMSTAVE